MSADNGRKRRVSSRSKGAAIAWARSPEASAVRGKRRFSMRLQLILIVVALLECLLLVGISTYSWIESTSSLIIRGDDMPVKKNRAYQMAISTSNTTRVDLHDYFSSTAYFQFAKTSSPDGKTFYFPKFNDIIQYQNSTPADVPGFPGAYRKGDTTDYNTTYYCFDINLNNTGSQASNYYFSSETNKIFTVTGIDNNTVKEAAAKCYRLSVQQGNDITIFSNETTSYTAVNNTTYNTANSAPVTSRAIDNYKYGSDLTGKTEVCKASAGSDSGNNVTFRIWFELNDPAYKELSKEQKQLLYDSKVNIDLVLMNAASDTRSMYFDDYSGATLEATGNSASRRMYLAYKDTLNSNKMTYYRMVPYEYNSEHVLWRTADSALNPSDLISKAMITNMQTSEAYNGSYFFYGTLTDGTESGDAIIGGTPAIMKKWKFNDEPLNTGENDSGTYTYVAYGVTDNNTDNYDKAACYGTWRGTGDDNKPTLIYFDDKLVYGSATDYNMGAISPIEAAQTGGTELNRVYVSTGNGVSTGNAKVTARMRYNADVGMYRAYLPQSAFSDTTYFYYLGTTDYNSTYKLKFTAAGKPEGKNTYTALGYSGTGGMPSSGGTGYGTWDTAVKVTFTTELIDHDISGAYRYKITYANPANNSETYTYYLAGETDQMRMYAYMPEGAASAGFYRYANNTSSTQSAAWASSARNGSTTYYPIETTTAAGQSDPRGYWHIAVLVDGTRDNLVNTILTENSEQASLQYTYNDSEYSDMLKIDNYRWCVPDLTDQTTVTYRFTAYTGQETDANNELLGYYPAIFDLQHDLSDGIYYTLTEPAQSMNDLTPEP